MKHPKTMLRAIAVLGTSCAMSPSIAMDGPTDDLSVVARFDEALAMGLPQTILLPRDNEHDPGENEPAALTLLSRMAVDIRMPNGDTIDMFDARVDGARAVVSRRADHVDVTMLHDDSLDTRGFTLGMEETEHVTRPAAGPVEFSGQPDPIAQGSSDAGTVHIVFPERAAKDDPLTINIFVHDDTGIVDGHDLYRDYLSWWLAELREKTVPDQAIRVDVVGRIRGVTDMKYGGNASITRWTSVVAKLVEKRGFRRTHKDKYLLFTKNEISPGLSGVALRNQSEAIASKAGGYSIIAHELGHTLGALHEDAEVHYGGWWCETNMYGSHSPFRSHCYVYSDKNRARIRDYIAHGVL
jgi:hypothetical protein